jgi:hypothetical protein
MEENIRLTKDDLEQITKSSKEILEKFFQNLGASAAVKGEAGPRFFFPGGIELIDVTVTVNVKEGIKVQVKVAGEKGLKGTAASAENPVVEAGGQGDGTNGVS